MYKLIAIFPIIAFFCGCGERREPPHLQPLARGFSQVWLPAPHDFNLDIRSENDGEQVIMRCVLQNLSGKVIEVDESTLPCSNPDLFSAIAIAPDGTVVGHKMDAPAFLSRIGPPREPKSITPNEPWQGNLDLQYVPLTNLPRNEDLLLVWSYGNLKNWSTGEAYVLSGITLLKASSRSPAPSSPKPQSNSAINATSSSP